MAKISNFKDELANAWSQMAHVITHRTPHTTIPHIHPTSLTTPRNTFIAPRNHDLFVCRRAKRKTTLTCDLFKVVFIPFQISQRKPFTSGLRIPGNSLSAHKNRKHRHKKIADSFHLQTHNANKEFPFAPVAPACSTNRLARLLGWFRHKVKQRQYHTCCQLVTSRPSLSTWPAESSGRRLKLSFRQAALGFPPIKFRPTSNRIPEYRHFEDL